MVSIAAAENRHVTGAGIDCCLNIHRGARTNRVDMDITAVSGDRCCDYHLIGALKVQHAGHV